MKTKDLQPINFFKSVKYKNAKALVQQINDDDEEKEGGEFVLSLAVDFGEVRAEQNLRFKTESARDKAFKKTNSEIVAELFDPIFESLSKKF